MPKRLMPSMAALQCFEAVARHLSATHAARELHLTQSAVSKQIAQLETLLQNALFRRVRKRLQLTPAGDLYLAEVRKILNQVDMSSRYIQSYGGDTEVLTVTAPPTFAARWLIPRLLGFGQRYPKIHLDIRTESDPFDLFHKQADVAFFFGEGTRPGAECLRLFSEDVVAVCAPDMFDAAKPPTLEELANARLLQLSHRPEAWHDWFAAKGMNSAHSYHGPRFETFDMSLHAARAGCGIALVPSFLIEEELRERKLALAWPQGHVSEAAYYLAYAEHAADVPKIRALVEWVREQLADASAVEALAA